MLSASAMSAMIRAKKKKMEEDHSDAVKLSGIPMDAQEIEILKQHETTDAMDENHPKEHSDGESLSPAAESDDEEKEQKTAKMAKIKLMMAKMSSKK